MPLLLGQIVVPLPPRLYLSDGQDKEKVAVVVQESPLVFSSLDAQRFWVCENPRHYVAVGSLWRSVLKLCLENWQSRFETQQKKVSV